MFGPRGSVLAEHGPVSCQKKHAYQELRREGQDRNRQQHHSTAIIIKKVVSMNLPTVKIQGIKVTD